MFLPLVVQGLITTFAWMQSKMLGNLYNSWVLKSQVRGKIYSSAPEAYPQIWDEGWN